MFSSSSRGAATEPSPVAPPLHQDVLGSSLSPEDDVAAPTDSIDPSSWLTIITTHVLPVCFHFVWDNLCAGGSTVLDFFNVLTSELWTHWAWICVELFVGTVGMWTINFVVNDPRSNLFVRRCVAYAMKFVGTAMAFVLTAVDTKLCSGQRLQEYADKAENWVVEADDILYARTASASLMTTASSSSFSFVADRLNWLLDKVLFKDLYFLSAILKPFVNDMLLPRLPVALYIVVLPLTMAALVPGVSFDSQASMALRISGPLSFFVLVILFWRGVGFWQESQHGVTTSVAPSDRTKRDAGAGNENGSGGVVDDDDNDHADDEADGGGGGEEEEDCSDSVVANSGQNRPATMESTILRNGGSAPKSAPAPREELLGSAAAAAAAHDNDNDDDDDDADSPPTHGGDRKKSKGGSCCSVRCTQTWARRVANVMCTMTVVLFGLGVFVDGPELCGLALDEAIYKWTFLVCTVMKVLNQVDMLFPNWVYWALPGLDRVAGFLMTVVELWWTGVSFLSAHHARQGIPLDVALGGALYLMLPVCILGFSSNFLVIASTMRAIPKYLPQSVQRRLSGALDTARRKRTTLWKRFDLATNGHTRRCSTLDGYILFKALLENCVFICTIFVAFRLQAEMATTFFVAGNQTCSSSSDDGALLPAHAQAEAQAEAEATVCTTEVGQGDLVESSLTMIARWLLPQPYSLAVPWVLRGAWVLLVFGVVVQCRRAFNIFNGLTPFHHLKGFDLGALKSGEMVTGWSMQRPPGRCTDSTVEDPDSNLLDDAWKVCDSLLQRCQKVWRQVGSTQATLAEAFEGSSNKRKLKDSINAVRALRSVMKETRKELGGALRNFEKSQATVFSTAQHRVKVSFLLNLPVKSKYRGTVDEIKVPNLAVECTRTATEEKGSGLQELFLKLDVERNSQVQFWKGQRVVTKRGDEGYIFLIDRRTANEREGISPASPRTSSPRAANVLLSETPEQWIYHVRYLPPGAINEETYEARFSELSRARNAGTGWNSNTSLSDRLCSGDDIARTRAQVDALSRNLDKFIHNWNTIYDGGAFVAGVDGDGVFGAVGALWNLIDDFCELVECELGIDALTPLTAARSGGGGDSSNAWLSGDWGRMWRYSAVSRVILVEEIVEFGEKLFEFVLKQCEISSSTHAQMLAYLWPVQSAVKIGWNAWCQHDAGAGKDASFRSLMQFRVSAELSVDFLAAVNSRALRRSVYKVIDEFLRLTDPTQLRPTALLTGIEDWLGFAQSLIWPSGNKKNKRGSKKGSTSAAAAAADEEHPTRSTFFKAIAPYLRQSVLGGYSEFNMSFTNSANGLNPRVNFTAEDVFRTVTRQAARDSITQNRSGSASTLENVQSRSSNNSSSSCCCCCSRWRSSAKQPASNVDDATSAAPNGTPIAACDGHSEGTEVESASPKAGGTAVEGRAAVALPPPAQTNAAKHVALKNILDTALQKLAPGDRLWPGTTRQIVLKMQRILDEDFQYMRQMYARQRRMGGDYVGPIFLSPEQFEAKAASAVHSRAQLDAEVKAYTMLCHGHAGEAQKMLGASHNHSSALGTTGGRGALLFPNAIHPAFLRDCRGVLWELQAVRILQNAVTGNGKTKYFDVRATALQSPSSQSQSGTAADAAAAAASEDHNSEEARVADAAGLGGDWLADPQINLNHEGHRGVYDTDPRGVRLAVARLETGKLQFSTRVIAPRPFFVHRVSHNDYAIFEVRQHPTANSSNSTSSDTESRHDLGQASDGPQPNNNTAEEHKVDSPLAAAPVAGEASVPDTTTTTHGRDVDTVNASSGEERPTNAVVQEEGAGDERQPAGIEDGGGDPPAAEGESGEK